MVADAALVPGPDIGPEGLFAAVDRIPRQQERRTEDFHPGLRRQLRRSIGLVDQLPAAVEADRALAAGGQRGREAGQRGGNQRRGRAIGDIVEVPDGELARPARRPQRVVGGDQRPRHDKPPRRTLVAAVLRRVVVDADGEAVPGFGFDELREEDVARLQRRDPDRPRGHEPQAAAAVQERHVDSAVVRRVEVDDLVIGLFQPCPLQQGAQRVAVLHLGEAHDVRQRPQRILRIEQRLRNRRALRLEAPPCPAALPARREFPVGIPAPGIPVIEKVLHIEEQDQHAAGQNQLSHTAKMAGANGKCRKNHKNL